MRPDDTGIISAAWGRAINEKITRMPLRESEGVFKKLETCRALQSLQIDDCRAMSQLNDEKDWKVTDRLAEKGRSGLSCTPPPRKDLWRRLRQWRLL